MSYWCFTNCRKYSRQFRQAFFIESFKYIVACHTNTSTSILCIISMIIRGRPLIILGEGQRKIRIWIFFRCESLLNFFFPGEGLLKYILSSQRPFKIFFSSKMLFHIYFFLYLMCSSYLLYYFPLYSIYMLDFYLIFPEEFGCQSTEATAAWHRDAFPEPYCQTITSSLRFTQWGKNILIPLYYLKIW